MKKVLSILLCACMLLCLVPVAASAQEAEPVTKTTVEYLENGDYFVTVVTQDAPVTRNSTTSGSKTGTYYHSNGTALWAVTVQGSFSYLYASYASATSASASVALYHSNTSFVSKDAYTSGASAYATATVKYGGTTTTKTVKLTCDKYGNLS